MAELIKGKRRGIWMSIAELVFAYNILEGSPLPKELDYHDAQWALQAKYGSDLVCSTANSMDMERYIRGNYAFQRDCENGRSRV